MKTILTIIVTTVLSVNGFSQLEVTESPKDIEVWASASSIPSLRMYPSKTDTSYTIFYKNAKYSHIVDIKYLTIGDRETTIQFFEALLDVSENNKELFVKLNGDNWLLKKSGKGAVIFSEFSYFNLRTKQIQEILNTLK